MKLKVATAAEVLDLLRAAGAELVFVPALARQAQADVRAALLELAAAEAVELRMESAVGGLSSDDAALCPVGWNPNMTAQDWPLSYVRLRSTALAVVEPATVPTALATNPAAVYLASFPSANSRATMKRALARIVEKATHRTEHLDAESGELDAAVLGFNWTGLRYQHTQAIRSTIAAEYASPSTVNTYLAALRGVLKEAWRLGLMTGDDYTRAADVRSVKGSRVPKGREVKRGELGALFDTCADDTSAAGRRDAAMLGLLAGGGLRRAEVVALQLADYEAASGILTLTGKGNKQRTVHLTNGTADALAEWLAVRGAAPGPLFYRVNKGGRIIAAAMTPQAVRDMLAKRAAGAGGIAKLSPHDFRRTFVSTLLDTGVDIKTVADMAGHSSVVTTQRYDRRGERAKRAAAELIHVPFRSVRAG